MIDHDRGLLVLGAKFFIILAGYSKIGKDDGLIPDRNIVISLIGIDVSLWIIGLIVI